MIRPAARGRLRAAAMTALVGTAVAACMFAPGHPVAAERSEAPGHTEPAADVPPTGSYILPGTVGYRGNQVDLDLIDSPESIPARIRPMCGSYLPTQGLTCDADNVILDHIHTKSGIYWTGKGNLTIRNSIIEGGSPTGDVWFTIYAIQLVNTGCVIRVEDSTLKWNDTDNPVPTMNGASAIHGQCRILAYRNDISGGYTGLIPTTDDVVIDSNYIHDLKVFTNGDVISHGDGIYAQSGHRALIQRNYVDIGWDGAHQTAALFLNDLGGGVNSGYRIYANFLSGGGYTFINSSARDVDARNNTFDVLPDQFGDGYTTGAGSIAIWTGNVHTVGTPVPHIPRQE